MSRENTGDGAMLTDIQDSNEVPFPITEPHFAQSKLDSAHFEDNSASMTNDFCGKEVLSLNSVDL